MSTETRDKFIHHIFTTVAPYVDALSHGFSLGLDRSWRKTAVALSGIRPGDRVLDICAGTGELARLLVPAVGDKGSVTASDFCENMLAIARQKLHGHRNVSFVLADAKDLPFPDGSFDAVTVSFGMRNIPDTIPAKTYSFQNEDIKTVTTTGCVNIRSAIPDEIAYKLTKVAWERWADLLKGMESLKWIKPGDILNQNAPLHPGAAKYYKEIGIQIPDQMIWRKK